MSEWKADAATRRDERATKVDLEPRHSGRGRKNTRRWCKGRVGREHVKVVELDPRYGHYGKCDANVTWFPCRHHEVCTVCGKELRFFLPIDECPILSGSIPT